MNRSLKLSVLVALALGSSQLLAVDFGQLQVKSALGQPLLAEIPLHQTSPAELKSLTVKLASSEQFARAGIVGGRTSIPLHFSVANTAGNHPVIRITSSVPVDDPYLDLLIEVNGKTGPSVREYAILLDPPGMHEAAMAAAAPAAAPAEPRQAGPATAAMVPPRQPAATAPAPAPALAPAGVNNGRYGPVQSGQTLTGIARNLAPTGVDVQQMVLALKQANPDAFYRDNINALKSGAVLRVPTSTEAQTMTLAAAMAEVRRQNSDWRAGTPGKPAVVADAATRASASSSPSATPSSHGDRLALVPAKAGGDTTGNAGQGAESSAKLRDELLRTKETLASLQQQGSDLKTRLKDLSDINSKNEHLLSLKDSQIAELQAKLAAARKATRATAPEAAAATSAAAASSASASTPAAVAPAVAGAGSSAGANRASVGAATTTLAEPAPAVASSGAIAAGSSVASAATSTTAAMSTAAVASTTASRPAIVAPAGKPVPAPVPAIGQPWYMQAWAWIAGAAIVVLLIVLAALGRRRKPVANSGTSLADHFGPVPPTDDGSIDADDTDQAQLLDQLAEHPDDIYLHLELVTLYYSRRDVEHFEAAAEAMYVHIVDPAQDEWQDVVHMGEDLAPEHPLFDHHEEASPSESDARRAFNIDDYGDEDDASNVVSPLPPALPTDPKKVSEYNFDFDLTHPAATDTDSPLPPTTDHVTAFGSHGGADAWMAPAADVPPASEFAEEPVDFSDDPVDTKLDLARAYLDMGDADGARAMLGEVLKEGSQMQRDTARELLDGLN
ncbi:MAG TPA: FimV/HubP family polar landmark protein [Rhodanobacter sp.]|jgi:pilus assembly protein FimV|nr:FimV/HubP family polar landmark protein [Rhodanobacter sp.]